MVQTKIGAVTGTMLILIGLTILFGQPDTHMSAITEDWLEDVPSDVWGVINVIAGIGMTLPGRWYRSLRIYLAAFVTFMWGTVVSIWPYFTEGPTDRMTLLGFIGWTSWTVLLILDKDNALFDPKFERYKSKGFDNDDD